MKTLKTSKMWIFSASLLIWQERLLLLRYLKVLILLKAQSCPQSLLIHLKPQYCSRGEYLSTLRLSMSRHTRCAAKPLSSTWTNRPNRVKNLTSRATFLSVSFCAVLSGGGFCLTDVYRDWVMSPRCVLLGKTSGARRDLPVIPSESCGGLSLNVSEK